jgi:hypothetical protein
MINMTNGNGNATTTTSFSSREYSGWPGCKRDEGGALNGVLTSLTSLVLIVQVIVVVVNKVIYSLLLYYYMIQMISGFLQLIMFILLGLLSSTEKTTLLKTQF